MGTSAVPWDAIHARPDFDRLVRERRAIMLRLLAVSMSAFLSIPLISHSLPHWFHTQVIGEINLGLLFLVGQYAIGGAVAWRYCVQLRRLDAQAAELARLALDSTPSHTAR